MQRTVSIVAVFAASLWAPFGMAAAQTVPAIGPFRPDMSFEQARAATPTILWTPASAQPGARPSSIFAARAVRVRGRDYDVTLSRLRYGAGLLRLQRVDTGTRARTGCQVEAQALVAELEDRLGPILPLSPFSPEETGLLPFALRTDSPPDQRVSAGKTSALEEFDARGSDRIDWVGGRRDANSTVLVNARSSAAADRPACVTWITLTFDPHLPVEWLDASRLPPPDPLSKTLRRLSFHGLAELPREKASVTVDCAVDRDTGVMSDCKAEATVGAVLGRPAERQASYMRMNTAYLDPAKDAPLRTRLAIDIDPADAARLRITPESGWLKYTEVTWDKRPDSLALMDIYPARALRTEVTANVKLLCRIEPDGALTCEDSDVDAGDDGLDFASLGAKIQRLYHAAPTLPDGSPSAGRRVLLSFAFRIPQ